MNNNITESYCSYEVSKLLKEKGFNIYQPTQYESGVNKQTVYNYTQSQCEFFGDVYYRPTHALVIEWLRVNFGIWIVINFANKTQWYFDCNKVNTSGKEKRLYSSNYLFVSPQEATEAALLYTLINLI